MYNTSHTLSEHLRKTEIFEVCNLMVFMVLSSDERMVPPNEKIYTPLNKGLRLTLRLDLPSM